MNIPKQCPPSNPTNSESDSERIKKPALDEAPLQETPNTRKALEGTTLFNEQLPVNKLPTIVNQKEKLNAKTISEQLKLLNQLTQLGIRKIQIIEIELNKKREELKKIQQEEDLYKNKIAENQNKINLMNERIKGLSQDNGPLTEPELEQLSINKKAYDSWEHETRNKLFKLIFIQDTNNAINNLKRTIVSSERCVQCLVNKLKSEEEYIIKYENELKLAKKELESTKKSLNLFEGIKQIEVIKQKEKENFEQSEITKNHLLKDDQLKDQKK